MTITAVSAMGTVFKRNGVAIGDVKGISGPSLTRDIADVTALDSENGFEEAMPTILRTGDITFTLALNQDDANHEQLRDDLVTASGQTWAITFPQTTSGTQQTHTFEGFVTSYSISAETGSEVQVEVAIKPSSTVTVTT